MRYALHRAQYICSLTSRNLQLSHFIPQLFCACTVKIAMRECNSCHSTSFSDLSVTNRFGSVPQTRINITRKGIGYFILALITKVAN